MRQASTGDLAPDQMVRNSFDTDGAADYIGCSAGYLIKLRGEGGGPAFHRLFKRKGITYYRADIDQWLASRRFSSTAEYPETLR
ncbi:hypothetical protein SAMN05216382_2697 [Sphingomonas palmae]|uniref:Helix-turn-helix domain-containing protein n=1 Tax=Sphingomonas palmae TaxID=1855283 RepID=A0A1H7T9Q8_9SPHN|nr:helix-turn-helix domain-containing protein [Sphingomonas palmae]SEL80986.1 hypothetical protein SAMN05216382_2697 [Sphingomonas palmae]